MMEVYELVLTPGPPRSVQPSSSGADGGVMDPSALVTVMVRVNRSPVSGFRGNDTSTEGDCAIAAIMEETTVRNIIQNSRRVLISQSKKINALLLPILAA